MQEEVERLERRGSETSASVKGDKEMSKELHVGGFVGH